MIDVGAVLQELPHFETFCSVKKLHGFVEALRSDVRFEVNELGSSAHGVPIHHVRCGRGAVKALWLAFPHCNEPIGGLTAFGLLTLLQRDVTALRAADVEWHVVPCIDPDGALLNEGWTQKPFTFDNYMRNYYLQGPARQVDASFPIAHKKMTWNSPSCEAQLLKGLLDQIRPDFYCSLHNTRTGGPFYYMSQDIGPQYYAEIYALLEEQRFPLQKRPQWREVLAQYSAGITEMPSLRKYYDYLEKTTPNPEKEEVLRYGTSSMEYLANTKPDALIFVAEMGYVIHPNAESERDTARNLRQFSLRLEADNKFIASVLLEQWDEVKADVDTTSPLYHAVLDGWVLPDRERLAEGGMPVSRYPTRDLLLNPANNRSMTEADLLNACMVDGGFFYHLYAYQFVRLLEASPQTPAIRRAHETLERIFTEAHADLGRQIDFQAFRIISCDTLARTQLGSGLIALNSLLRQSS